MHLPVCSKAVLPTEGSKTPVPSPGPRGVTEGARVGSRPQSGKLHLRVHGRTVHRAVPLGRPREQDPRAGGCLVPRGGFACCSQSMKWIRSWSGILVRPPPSCSLPCHAVWPLRRKTGLSPCGCPGGSEPKMGVLPGGEGQVQDPRQHLPCGCGVWACLTMPRVGLQAGLGFPAEWYLNSAHTKPNTGAQRSAGSRKWTYPKESVELLPKTAGPGHCHRPRVLAAMYPCLCFSHRGLQVPCPRACCMFGHSGLGLGPDLSSAWHWPLLAQQQRPNIHRLLRPVSTVRS